MNVHERFKEYDGNKCWQAFIRDQNLESDLQESGLTSSDVQKLHTSDFTFSYVDKDDGRQCKEIRQFIERHEWLGKLPSRPTHRFTARYNGILAGVIVMGTPYAFSGVLGEENRHLEKLIARGACISWSPKNLGSWLIMQSIAWMVNNTRYRAFSAYSDPEAKELGTIYQACNFYYLGKGKGTLKQYFDPKNPNRGWFSSRSFRHKSMYCKYAEKAGYSRKWMKERFGKYSPDWSLFTEEEREQIRAQERLYRESCKVRKVPSKHKYVYILGKDKRETRKLRKVFENLNQTYEYPKVRGA